MTRKKRRLSLFAQPFDRAAFIAYFLGAVVPLAVAIWLATSPVGAALPAPWRRGIWVALAALVLGSFLALRRTARAILARLDRDNSRLAALLAASRSLAATRGDREVMRVAAESAPDVAGARAAFFLTRLGEDRWQLAEASSAEARRLHDAHAPALARAAETAQIEMRPALEILDQGPRTKATPPIAVAMPCGAEREHAGSLVAWYPDVLAHGPAEEQALAMLSALGTVAFDNVDRHDAERNFFTHATNLLVAALDAHLAHQTDHSRRVARSSTEIGRELGFPEERIERLYFAALLHDIGMLRIDRERLFLEPALGRDHPALGAEMLQPIRLWQDLVPFVRHHHEWFDGNGYPDRLAGSAIPLEARIIAVAEAFDSMTSEKSYKAPVSAEVARERIRAATGTQFDPAVVRAWLSATGEAA